MNFSPQPRTRQERLALALRIQHQLMALHGADVLAIGLYGSLSRSTDGPFSDVEMMCVLRRAGIHDNHEWTVGAWKAEVNLRSYDVALHRASELDDDWPVSHGKFVDMQPLHDPEAFFPTLRARVLAHSGEDFRDCMREVIVGDIYELVGKWRNQLAAHHFDYVPTVAFKLSQYAARVAGLANRHLYTTGSLMFAESLALSNLPAGYDELCRMIMRGDLTDPHHVIGVCEAFWRGLVAWAEQNGIALISDPLDLG